ncbi:MAG TPA: anion transporter [Vicinamibacterales bacterium]|nr:anion transporter [Vicinamibacterales bacterium]
MDYFVAGVFALVYLGMILGEFPGLRLDRTGIALLGAIVLIASERISLDEAWAAIDVPTMALLLGLMVVSAQFRLGGFYTLVTRRLGASDHSPSGLLALVVITAGVLSAVLANDIVCLAMAPILVELCARRRLDPVPYLLALACAANVGSAATLIGNPQNMLIGEVLDLSFARYLWDAGIPSLAGLGIVWLSIAFGYRGRWSREVPVPHVEAAPFNRWQTAKGLALVSAIIAAFLFSSWPREVVALVAAGVLLMSGEMASREMLGEVDWHLLVLFAGLFIVNAAVQQSGLLDEAFVALRAARLDLAHPTTLFGSTVVLSNLVSNVPAVMLLLPAATHKLAGPILALASTLAGNLLIVGSIANIIVVDQARRLGVDIDWHTHARIGIPVTLATLAVAAAWLTALS